LEAKELQRTKKFKSACAKYTQCISTCERLTPDKFPAKIHSDAKVGLVECCVTLGKYGEAAIFATELPDQYTQLKLALELSPARLDEMYKRTNRRNRHWDHAVQPSFQKGKRMGIFDQKKP
jgi:hypothetical protein